MNILIFGLPGSGKTTLAEFLRQHIKAQEYSCAWFNADKVREMADDWDFSEEGRIRAASRMKNLCQYSPAKFKICDFVAPTKIIRDKLDFDFIIFMDTIGAGRFRDTNRIFERPDQENIDMIIRDWYNPGQMAMDVFDKILKVKQ